MASDCPDPSFLAHILRVTPDMPQNNLSPAVWILLILLIGGWIFLIHGYDDDDDDEEEG